MGSRLPAGLGRRVQQHGRGYRYRFASRWLPPLLAGTVPWEDFFLSLRFHQTWRVPDVYSDHLLGLLNFAHPKGVETV